VAGNITQRDSNNFQHVLSFRILSLYFITIFGFGGGFVFYAYVEPWLSVMGNTDPHQVSLSLALVGAGSLAGNLLGGILPTKLDPNKATIIVLILQILSLFGLESYPGGISSLPFLIIWAVAAFSLAPMMQTAIRLDKGSISDPRLSVSLNAMSFNFGIAAASYFGGILVDYGNTKSLPFAAALVVMIALLFSFIRLHRYR